jgi:hypothetical protein
MKALKYENAQKVLKVIQDPPSPSVGACAKVFD